MEVVERYGFAEKFLSSDPQVIKAVLCELRSR